MPLQNDEEWKQRMPNSQRRIVSAITAPKRLQQPLDRATMAGQRPIMRNLFAVIVAVCATLSPAFAAKQYSYFRVGNANDVTTSTTPGTVLMGGGTDVDAAFQWMCGRSGNGDFLVIRATGTDAYNPYIQQLCPGENSVATLIIPNRAAASDPVTVHRAGEGFGTAPMAARRKFTISAAPSLACP